MPIIHFTCNSIHVRFIFFSLVIKRKSVTINIHVEGEPDTKKVKVEPIYNYIATSITDCGDGEPDHTTIALCDTLAKAETALLKAFKHHFIHGLLITECDNERVDFFKFLQDIETLRPSQQITQLHNYKHNCDNYTEPCMFFVERKKVE
jgi:hypothetical protein